MRGGALALLTVLSLLGSSEAVVTNQDALPILSPTWPDDLDLEAVDRDAYFVFNSVHHLVRQWGAVFAPNGFSCTKGTIPFGTSLYHARTVSLSRFSDDKMNEPDLPHILTGC